MKYLHEVMEHEVITLHEVITSHEVMEHEVLFPFEYNSFPDAGRKSYNCFTKFDLELHYMPHLDTNNRLCFLT